MKTAPLAPVLEEEKLDAARVRAFGDAAAPASGTRHALVATAAGTKPDAAAAELVRFAKESLSDDGTLLVFVPGTPADAELAGWRNAAWPLLHAVAVYRLSQAAGVTKSTLQGTTKLRRGTGVHGAVLVLRSRAAVMAPDATVAKFDQNAAGWNGEPGRPGYAHFRWMRRFVADFAQKRDARRVLDFGSGAGWVGIEAALASGGAHLSAFDPSPQMMKLVEENARSVGLKDVAVATGFGEDPPFPRAGEAPYDLVLSSGVISFAPDSERWVDGLVRTVARGGTLVIGDIHRDSRGMRERRATRPLLPVREMNAQTREEVRSLLEPRGFTFEAWCGYQLTGAVPRLMHVDATRLRGALGGAILWWNRRATARDVARGGTDPDAFDSWVMRLVRR
ncbi:MAG: class I SAM-dependent methyltransferase [Planctomycetota bacterium]